MQINATVYPGWRGGGGGGEYSYVEVAATKYDQCLVKTPPPPSPPPRLLSILLLAAQHTFPTHTHHPLNESKCLTHVYILPGVLLHNLLGKKGKRKRIALTLSDANDFGRRGEQQIKETLFGRAKGEQAHHTLTLAHNHGNQVGFNRY